MNTSSYRIFLTKSKEAAALIFTGLQEMATGMKYNGISTGTVFDDDPRIPPVYYNQGFYYALLETPSDHPTYEIHIC